MNAYGKGRRPGTVARPLLGKKARAGLSRAVGCIHLTMEDMLDEELVAAARWLQKLAQFYEREDVKDKLKGKAMAQKVYKAAKKLDGETP